MTAAEAAAAAAAGEGGPPGDTDMPDGLCDVPDRILSAALASILASGGGVQPPVEPLPPPDAGASLFYGTSAQPFPLAAYTTRLVAYAGCSRAALLSALDLLCRAGVADPLLRLCDRNVHRLLVAAVAVAAKVHDDEVFSNAHYAAVGGVPSVPEMNALEAHLLRVLGWGVGLDRDGYRRWEVALLLHVTTEMRAAGQSRGVVGATPLPAIAAGGGGGGGGGAPGLGGVPGVGVPGVGPVPPASVVGDDGKPGASYRVGAPAGGTVPTVPVTHGFYAVGA